METTETACLSPIEQLHLDETAVIAQYLSVKDVGACCATSRVMRELFSNDAIWRSRCTKDLGEYLVKTPCKVEPGFISPECKNSTLSPVPKWKMLFMYENHLWNNWRQGNYKKVKFKIDLKSLLYINTRFFNNDCVMRVCDKGLYLFDVKDDPVVLATDPASFRLDFPLLFIAVDDQVIIVHDTLVHVYQPNFLTKQCSLKYAFKFNDASLLQINTPEELPLYCDNIASRFTYGCVSEMLKVVGKFFVGIIQGQSTMHIWDIKSGIKLKEQLCPLKFVKINSICTSSSTMNIVLTIENDNGLTTVLVYSLIKLDYLSFQVPFHYNIKCKINSDLVAIWNVNLNLFNVFNYISSDLLLKDKPAKTVPEVFRNGFIFVSDEKLETFNPSTRLCESLELGSVSKFGFLSSRFFWVKRNYKTEIRDIIGNRVKVRKITESEFKYFCTEFLTKSLDYNGVVHFW